jgi:hypothetical protein
MAKTLPWFRLYSEVVDDPKLRLLAFEDRWHYIALLCCKCQRIQDKDVDDNMLHRMISAKLGLSVNELDEVKRRLVEVDLIDDRFHPLNWDSRQHSYQRYPDGMKPDGFKGYVYFIGSESGPVKIGYSKNPWARLSELQTASADELSVVATVKTTEDSESSIHDALTDLRIKGEWFERNDLIIKVLSEIKDRKIKDHDALLERVRSLRSNYVATTTEVEVEVDSETDKETEKKSADAPPKNLTEKDCPEYLDPQIWRDFIGIRKAKKAPMTPTAWARMENQIKAGIKQGHSPDDMVGEAVERGWQTFKLEWYLNSNRGKAEEAQQIKSPARRELN